MTTKKGSNSLGGLLQRVQDVHRKDINDYCSGHLNHSKLWKAKDELYHKPWESSVKKPVIFVPPSKRVHIPVNKSNKSRMMDALVDYSVGPAGNLPVTRPPLPRKSSKSTTYDNMKTDTNLSNFNPYKPKGM